MFRYSLRHGIADKTLAIILMVSTLVWAMGLPMWLHKAYAITLAKDTLSSATPAAAVNHTFAFTTEADVAAAGTVKIQLDPATDGFTIGALVVGDIVGVGLTPVAVCGAGANEVTMVLDTVAPDENITFTVCAGDTVSAGALSLTLSNNRITSPAAGSYVIRYSATGNDTADTRVAIVADVAVTAAVDTTLTVEVGGYGIGFVLNNEPVTTTHVATATTLPFGTLAPGVAKVLGQFVNVTTNARNGFVLTVKSTGPFAATNGADIDYFKDGAETSVPVAWTAPLGTLDTEATYGHWGVSSSDSPDGNEFNGPKYAGNFSAARAIASHNGPSSGAVSTKGSANIVYKIEITALQEAATDYATTLQYVATPTF